MKPMRMVLVAGLMLLFASVSFGQTLDPVVGVGGGSGSAAINVPMFSIFSSSGTSPGTSDCVLMQNGMSTGAPGCFFQNDIIQNDVGQTITQLVFVVDNADFSNTLICNLSTQLGGAGGFSMCSVVTGALSSTITFFDGSIPFGGDFSFEFDHFNSNTTFAGTATVPEPSTLALFLGGIGALLARRRSRAR